MKKIIINIVAAFAAITMSAQTVNVHFKNGQVVEYPSANVEYVDFSSKPNDPTVTAGDAIDLGLSVLWASCNLGATKPEEYGDYYAWGETKSKEVYGQSTYTYYDNELKEYISIGTEISGTEYDAATVNLGNDWRMPTKDETEELLNECTWEWTRINNINGYLVTGKNGNSIFIPSAGYYENKYLQREGDKYGAAFRTSTHIDITGNAFSQTVYYCRAAEIATISKYVGYSIRPVSSNPNSGN